MLYMVGRDVKEFPYTGNGQCDFKNEQFEQVLKLIKNKSEEKQYEGYSEMYEAVMSGELLAIEDTIFGICSYGRICRSLGEYTNIVGYPNQTGNGNIMTASGLLVVNQASMEKPEVKKLIQYLPKNHDNTLYLEEYIQFINSAVPDTSADDEMFPS